MNERIGLIDRSTGMIERIVKVEQVQCTVCYSHIDWCTCKMHDPLRAVMLDKLRQLERKGERNEIR